MSSLIKLKPYFPPSYFQWIGILVFTFVIYSEIVSRHVSVDRESRPNGDDLNASQQEKKTNFEAFMKLMRKSDERLVTRLVDLNVEELSDSVAMDTVYQLVAQPLQGVCRTLKRFGGAWVVVHNAFDGDKFICLDQIREPNCLVYSFGINNEWSFEDMADHMGCEVFAYDHTIEAPEKRGKQIFFFKTGVATEETTNLDTLENLITKNGHKNRTISYLKADIEGEELVSLPQWIKNGVLDGVDQIALEFHLHTHHEQKHRFKEVLTVLQDMYKLNFRIVSYEPNTAMGKWGTDQYYSLFEIVFMKDNVWNYL